MRPASLLLISGLAVAACAPSPSPTSISSSRRTPADVPNGDMAGAAVSRFGSEIQNPHEGDAAAISDGKTLFVQMNCAGCHGYALTGSMGPNLTDRYWRYGGSPAAVYDSIAAGHPQGMPAWRNLLTDDQIWQIVAYIQTYGGVSTASDYRSALQGDEPTRNAGNGNSTGAHAGAKGGLSQSGQSATP